jgi:hypothetical protein
MMRSMPLEPPSSKADIGDDPRYKIKLKRHVLQQKLLQVQAR